MDERILVGDLVLCVRRSTKRKRVTLVIERNSGVLLHAPIEATLEQLTQFVHRHELWIHTKLQTKRAYSRRTYPQEYIDGEGFFYFGRSYRLRLVPTRSNGKTPILRLHGTWFELRADARPKAAQHFARWYAEQGQSWIENRVDFYASRIGIQPSKVEIRNLRNRWASCSKNGNINFHWRIVCLPPSIIDYIIAHELVHLVRPHHGKAFWQLLERTMPDYPSRKKWLDENGGLF